MGKYFYRNLISNLKSRFVDLFKKFIPWRYVYLNNRYRIEAGNIKLCIPFKKEKKENKEKVDIFA